MGITVPEKSWYRPPEGNERVWIGLALIWCLVMFVAMPYWAVYGKQNHAAETYTVEPAAFYERVERQAAQYTVGEEAGVPIVEPPPGADAYLLGRMWSWTPILKLKKGQEYRIHISSMDLQHGLAILPVNMNFQILPGYDHVLTITPTSSGEFSVICNEFCGVGHHLMTGRIIVVD